MWFLFIDKTIQANIAYTYLPLIISLTTLTVLFWQFSRAFLYGIEMFVFIAFIGPMAVVDHNHQMCVCVCVRYECRDIHPNKNNPKSQYILSMSVTQTLERGRHTNTPATTKNMLKQNTQNSSENHNQHCFPCIALECVVYASAFHILFLLRFIDEFLNSARISKGSRKIFARVKIVIGNESNCDSSRVRTKCSWMISLKSNTQFTCIQKRCIFQVYTNIHTSCECMRWPVCVCECMSSKIHGLTYDRHTTTTKLESIPVWM